MTMVQIMLCGSSLLLATAGPEAGDRGIFTGSYSEAFWTVVTFAVLLILLGRLAWRPLLAGLKAREDKIRRELEAAAEANRQAQQALQQARQQALTMIEQAKVQAQEAQAQVIKQTKRELELLRQDAEADIEHARMAAIEAIWAESAVMIKTLTERVLDRVITDEDDQRFIQQAIEQLRVEKTRI